jgi:acyl-coenzyme A synthetase/AMP-(fatty) acid ligase
MPEEREGPVTRLVAFVVAPGETSDSILTTLRTKMAPVFLPRPIYLVDALPRNHTGKLVKEDVETLLRTQTNPANTPQQ